MPPTIKSQKIVLIGSGNVATHLGKMISNTKGYVISQIYSKTKAHSRTLGLKLNVPSTHLLHEIYSSADIYILAVKDDAINDIAKTLLQYINRNALVLHTSGSVSVDTLKPYYKNRGVLYPLQTFSTKKKNTAHTVPFFITASSASCGKTMNALAHSISKDVKIVSDETRQVIHLSAVMVNNFPNYWYAMAEKLLQSQKIKFDILIPLIEETTLKIHHLSPISAQTGPARRKDVRVIKKHQMLLRNLFPEWLKAYNMMTRLISKAYT